MRESIYCGQDGTELFYRSLIPETPKALVILLHGYAEHSGRLDGLMESLYAGGFASFAPDHRGHGKSAVLRGYIESLDLMIEDIDALRLVAIEEVPGCPVFVLGHSMGGLLALRYAQSYQEHLTGAVAASAGILVPPDVPDIMVKLSHFLGRIVPKLGVQPFFNPSKSTRIPMERQILRDDPQIYKGWVRAKTGSELLLGMNATVAALERLTLPLLLIHGEADSIVLPEASELIRDQASSEDIHFQMIPNAYHDIFHEPEADLAFGTIINWLAERV